MDRLKRLVLPLLQEQLEGMGAGHLPVEAMLNASR